jgi:hypothetical protein
MNLLYIGIIIFIQILVFGFLLYFYSWKDKMPKANTQKSPQATPTNAHYKINKGMISIDSASTLAMLEKMKRKMDESENQNKPRDPNIVDNDGGGTNE